MLLPHQRLLMGLHHPVLMTHQMLPLRLMRGLLGALQVLHRSVAALSAARHDAVLVLPKRRAPLLRLAVSFLPALCCGLLWLAAKAGAQDCQQLWQRLWRALRA